MFYTLTNQFLIKNSGGERDFLYLFLIGSAMYVALHWYLHMDEIEGTLGRVKEYLYYLLVLDFVTCVIIFKMSPVKQRVDKEEENEEEKKELTLDEKKVILQKMQEARKLQQVRLRDAERERDSRKHSERDEKKGSDVSEKKKDESSVECKKDGKCKIFKSSENNLNKKSKTENSDNVSIISKNKSTKKIKTEKITDTEIPIFVQQNSLKQTD